jgi:hypothetical protein
MSSLVSTLLEKFRGEYFQSKLIVFAQTINFTGEMQIKISVENFFFITLAHLKNLEVTRARNGSENEHKFLVNQNSI